MGFVGLVPSEYSSGQRTRRGQLTRAGNQAVRTQLIESVWTYRFRPHISLDLRRRQEGASPATLGRSWNAQLRLFRAGGPSRRDTTTHDYRGRGRT